MEYDTIPELPNIQELFEVEQGFVIEEFLKSNTKFICYQNPEGEIRFFFKNMDAKLYSIIVVKLSDPSYENIYEFLKLSLEGTRCVKQNTKKGNVLAVKIARYIEEKFTKNPTNCWNKKLIIVIFYVLTIFRNPESSEI